MSHTQMDDDGPDQDGAAQDGALEEVLEHEPRGRRLGGCIPVLIVLLVLAAGVLLGGRWAVDQIGARFGDAPDYAGPGSGQVLYEVKAGASSAQIGRDLKAAGVVKSVDAFTEAAVDEPRSRGIQVGYYPLKKEMKAADALAVLVDPKSMVQSLVTIPEGARVSQIVKTIVAKTDITKKALTAALADPDSIGLPAEAEGNPEGYLFPATYSVPPRQTAVGLLSQMVAKSVQTEQALDVKTKAAELGLTPKEVLTVASILEFEANRDEDYPKVARAIYNRLDQKMPLQSDATVAFITGKTGTVYTTAQERESTSPYNTYKYPGLPPGPIGSPGAKTIEAALNPSSGEQLFWVVVNLRTGDTRFAETYGEHLRNVEIFREYCRTSDAC